MNRIIDLLNTADKAIKAKHRYFCGLEKPAEAGGERLRVFFQSPDGQNGELYYALRELGLVDAGYNAPYHWKLREYGTGWFLTYTEGDVDVHVRCAEVPGNRLCLTARQDLGNETA